MDGRDELTDASQSSDTAALGHRCQLGAVVGAQGSGQSAWSKAGPGSGRRNCKVNLDDRRWIGPDSQTVASIAIFNRTRRAFPNLRGYVLNVQHTPPPTFGPRNQHRRC